MGWRRGWFRESHRHSLAARGISTSRYMVSKSRRQRQAERGLSEPPPAIPRPPPVLKTGKGFMSTVAEEKMRIRLSRIAREDPEKKEQYMKNQERIEEILRELQRVNDANMELNEQIKSIKMGGPDFVRLPGNEEGKLTKINRRMADIAAQFEAGPVDDVKARIEEYKKLFSDREEILEQVQALQERKAEVAEGILGGEGELANLRKEQIALLKFPEDEKFEERKRKARPGEVVKPLPGTEQALQEDLMRSLEKVQKAQAAMKGPALLETEQPVFLMGSQARPGSITGGIKRPLEEGKQPVARKEGLVTDQIREQRQKEAFGKTLYEMGAKPKTQKQLREEAKQRELEKKLLQKPMTYEERQKALGKEVKKPKMKEPEEFVASAVAKKESLKDKPIDEQIKILMGRLEKIKKEQEGEK